MSYQQRNQIKDFKGVTGASDDAASRALSKCGYNLERALDYYYSNRHEFPADKRGDKKKLGKLFDQYADPDSKEDLAGDELIKFLTDAGIDVEKAESMGVCWRLNCKDQGMISREEFVEGFSALGVDTMPKIKTELKTVKAAMTGKQEFKSFYSWLFNYCVEGNRKTIDKEVAVQMWQTILPPHWKLTDDWCAFVESHKIKAISKDVWGQVLEFAREIDGDITKYDENGAWPVIIDEFIEYMQEKQSK